MFEATLLIGFLRFVIALLVLGASCVASKFNSSFEHVLIESLRVSVSLKCFGFVAVCIFGTSCDEPEPKSCVAEVWLE